LFEILFTQSILRYLLVYTNLASCSANTTSGSSSANPNDPIATISGMIQAINNQDPNQYMTYFTNSNQEAMKGFLSINTSNSSSASTFFKEKQAKLIQIKELPKDVDIIAAGISPRENLNMDNTRVYYAELFFKVDNEGKWLYNGVNHRIIVVTDEDGNWKIVRLSVPSMEYLKDTGNGFNSKDEDTAINIEKALETNGTVLNMKGAVIDNIAATDKQLAEEKSGPKAIEPEITMDLKATDEHTRPSSIRVYMTYSVNTQHWGSGTHSVDFGTYVYNVLPNEWGTITQTTAVQAGAIACKMYGWYHVYHPKWNFSPYYADVQDNTNDQVYKYNSATNFYTQKINSVGGIGVDILSNSTYILFETHHIRGSYASGGQYGGYMWQLGTSYWADQGKGYTFMCHYYWDKSSSKPIHFFYY
jgi:hypothetical protein